MVPSTMKRMPSSTSRAIAARSTATASSVTGSRSHVQDLRAVELRHDRRDDGSAGAGSCRSGPCGPRPDRGGVLMPTPSEHQTLRLLEGHYALERGASEVDVAGDGEVLAVVRGPDG